MSATLILLGLIMVLVGARGTYQDFGKLLVSEFQGANSFLWFAVAIFVLAALGNIKEVKPVSNAFLLLVLVVLVIAQQKGSGGGFFESLMSQLQGATTPNVTAPPAPPALPPAPSIPRSEPY